MSTLTLDREQLNQDPTAKTEVHELDDRFIPLRAEDIAERLVRDAPSLGVEPRALKAAADGVMDVLRQEVGSFERAVAALYANVNPDRDTVPIADISEAR